MSSNPQPVDGVAVANTVAIVINTLTIVLGMLGNPLVIWVAGFRMKVRGAVGGWRARWRVG